MGPHHTDSVEQLHVGVGCVVHQVTYSKLANLELLKHDRDVTHAQTRIVGDIDEGKVEISRGQSVKNGNRCVHCRDVEITSQLF